MPRVSKQELQKRDQAYQIGALAESLSKLTEAIVTQNTKIEALVSRVASLEEAPLPERVVVAGQTTPEVEMPAPTDGDKGVVFIARDKGFRQVLKKSSKVMRGDGDFEIVPPVLAEFTDSRMLRITDEEQIRLMREKIDMKRRKGWALDVYELKDERIAETVESAPKEAIVNPNVNVNSSPEEVMVS